MRASVSMRVRECACACVCACACARAQPSGDAARRGPRRGWERTPQPCVRRRQSRSPRPRPRRRPHRDRHGHPPRGTPVTEMLSQTFRDSLHPTQIHPQIFPKPKQNFNKILPRSSQILPKPSPNPSKIDPRSTQEASWRPSWSNALKMLDFERPKIGQERERERDTRTLTTTWVTYHIKSKGMTEAIHSSQETNVGRNGGWCVERVGRRRRYDDDANDEISTVRAS